MKLAIDRIVVQVKETKAYEVVISVGEGFDMPETVEGTIEFVNEIHGDSRILDLPAREAIAKEITITDYRIEGTK